MASQATMFVRDARVDDLAVLTEVWSPWYIHSALARATTNDLVYLVAEVDGEVAGQLCIDPKAFPGSGYIFAISVREALQSRGVGTHLVRAAEDRIAGLGFTTVTLKVEHTNVRARALYERLGYKVTEDGWDEWDDREADGQVVRHVKVATWLMEKTLES